MRPVVSAIGVASALPLPGAHLFDDVGLGPPVGKTADVLEPIAGALRVLVGTRDVSLLFIVPFKLPVPVKQNNYGAITHLNLA